MSDKGQIRIIVKKKGGHHNAHHGGSWKVAYADFVTAMMAFFMVMWIMGMDPQQKDLIQGYFQNPVGFKQGFGAGTNPMSQGNAVEHMGARTIAVASRDIQRQSMTGAAERIRWRLTQDEDLAKLAGNFEIIVTNEGMRIEMIDGASGQDFFPLSSATPSELAQRALRIIGEELSGLVNDVVIEGHTDARPYGSRNYSNWELSTDRANAARRMLNAAGIPVERVREVRGHADRALRVASDPLAPANRRVSMLIPFEDPDTLSLPALPTPPDAEGGTLPALATPPVASGASAGSH